MSAVVVRLAGLTSGRPCALDGLWLVDYDPTRPGVDPAGLPMSAHIEVSADRGAARRFASASQVHAYWTRDSGRVRPDGRPDRPLTAFHLLIESDEQEAVS